MQILESPSNCKDTFLLANIALKAAEMKLEIASLKGLPSLLEKEILSALLKYKWLSSWIPLLTLMIIRIIAVIIPRS
jgi:hypothetical protein